MSNRRLGTVILTIALAIGAAGAGAQAPASLPGLTGIRSKAEIDALVARLRSGALKGAQPLFEQEHGTYRVYTSYIDHRKGLADIHVDDDEIFVVLSGAAQCTLGGDIANKTLGPGPARDYHGTEIVGGVTRAIAEGDVVSAPRGTAHQMDAGTGHILYIVIKIIGKS